MDIALAPARAADAAEPIEVTPPQTQGYGESQIVDAIARTDYDRPIARQRTVAPPPGAALTREGGVFRRFLDGFRYR
jgi:hypothetical protein